MRPARASCSISSMNSLAELARLIENLIRLGTVAEVQVEPPRVRVKTGNVTTAWRPWFALRAGADREWDPPTIGEVIYKQFTSGRAQPFGAALGTLLLLIFIFTLWIGRRRSEE